MSLITLNSNGQDPYFFGCHFPQPIQIKPYSQVCLLKFIHFRDSHVYNITTANNLLKFCIGNTRLDGIRNVRITPGQYTGDELATELEDQMNNVLQQQHYEWEVIFTPEDDTTSPPTLEKFKISYASVATPALSALLKADMTQLSNFLDLSVDGQIRVEPSKIFDVEDDYPEDAGYVPNRTLICPKGLLTNDGAFEVSDIPFSGKLFNLSAGDDAENFAFDDLVIGMVRNELSALSNANPNLVFNPRKQDVNINFNQDGLNIQSIKIAGNTRLGSETYASAKPCRLIPTTAFKQIFTQNGLDANAFPLFRFRIKYTLLAVNRRVVIQLFKSDDNGNTYAPMVSAEMGNDGDGNPYLNTFTAADGTVYDSVIWVSDKEEFNDKSVNPAGGFTSNKVQNVFITKKCPYKPSITYVNEPTFISGPDYTTGGDLVFEDGSGNAATFSTYAGINGYEFQLQIATDPNTYYFVPEATNPFEYKMSIADAPYAGDGSATFDATNETLTITLNGGGAGPVISITDGTLDTEHQSNPILEIQQILNPTERPLSLANTNDGSPFNYESESAAVFGDEPELQAAEGGTDLGADVSKTAILFMRQLTTADVDANSATPAYLTAGQPSGTIGTTLGSEDNIIVATQSSGQDIFESGMPTQKVAKDTVLNISIPELAGVKSFNGIDQGAGSKLSGEAKNIAVLPREEFQTRGENTNHGLVYIAPFENWLDLHNGSELYINQLSVEVRQPSGQLSTDLRPDTICQIKFRQDPAKLAEQKEDERLDALVLALSSATQTGQVLSRTLYNTGS